MYKELHKSPCTGIRFRVTNKSKLVNERVGITGSQSCVLVGELYRRHLNLGRRNSGIDKITGIYYFSSSNREFQRAAKEGFDLRDRYCICTRCNEGSEEHRPSLIGWLVALYRTHNVDYGFGSTIRTNEEMLLAHCS
jgi:hypothetical protein